MVECRYSVNNVGIVYQEIYTCYILLEIMHLNSSMVSQGAQSEDSDCTQGRSILDAAGLVHCTLQGSRKTSSLRSLQGRLKPLSVMRPLSLKDVQKLLKTFIKDLLKDPLKL